MSDRPTVLYIAGLGRSGSTLLDRALGATDGCHTLGEVVHVWSRGVDADERCGCGEPFSTCPFWTKVGQVAFGGWDSIDRDELRRLQASVDRTRHVPLLTVPRLRSGFRTAVARYGSLLSKLYLAAAEVSGADVLIDSSKHVSTAYMLRHVPGIDARVLHLVRDPRGVAYSWTKRKALPSAGDGAQMARYSPLKTSMLYLVQNGMLDLLSLSATPRLRVRYEDFVAEPRWELDRILAFAGKPGTTRPHVRPGEVDLGPNHIVGGNPMKGRLGTVPLRRDDDWRAAMDPTARRLVSGLTFPLRLAYHYRGRL